MKIFLLATVCLLAACNNISSEETNLTQSSLPDISTIAKPNDPVAAKMVEDFLTIMDNKMALAAEIGRIETRDQYVREVFIDTFSNPDLDPDVRAAFQKAGGEYVAAIDEINTREFKHLMKNLTWRELATSESRLASRAFRIVQHTPDNKFQSETLAEIKPLAEEGLMEGQLYALMYDRVNLKKEGGTQLYGTQTKCVDGVYDVFNLEEPETVDERRAKLGMGPLEEYIKGNREYYGPC